MSSAAVFCISAQPPLACAGKHAAPAPARLSSLPARLGKAPLASSPGSATATQHTHRLVSRAVMTDQTVPEGHKGLHGFLYGEGGAEVHDFAREYVFREGEDDGQYLVNAAEYIASRETDRPVGVYAVYDQSSTLQYVGYSRNVVASLKGHLLELGPETCAFVRSLIIRNKAMTTRESLEKISAQWLAEADTLPAGNSTEQQLWERQARAKANADKQEYEEKKLKMRKAMGEDLHKEVAGEAEDSRQRRLNLIRAMESDDWSAVIDAQTQGTLENGAAASGAEASPAGSGGPVPTSSSWPGPPQRVTPFAQARVHRSIGDRAEQLAEMSVETVDQSLEEVRPYLMADGGNVTVVGVDQGLVYLRLEGACGTCASSTSTMKMGIERALQAAFGSQLKGVEQVDVQNAAATVVGVDSHLDQLRPAINSYGGRVKVLSVDNGLCTIGYNGPAPIGMGIQAAIKDKFPDVKEVTLVS